MFTENSHQKRVEHNQKMKTIFKIKWISLGLLLILICIYFGGYFYINQSNKGKVTVLAYHHFMDEQEKEQYAKNNYNVISTTKFEEQLRYLKENKYQSIKPKDLECYMKNKCKLPEKAVLITIDDGNISTYYKALPLLEKYNFNSLVFVISSRVNAVTEAWDPKRLAYLGEDKIQEIKMKHKSMSIGSHSHQLHDLINGQNPSFAKTKNEIFEDVKKSKEILNAEYYAYPFGVSSSKYIDALKEADYKMAFTFKDYKMASNKNDQYTIPRVEIRGDYDMKQFKNALKAKLTLTQYTKKIIKKSIGWLFS